MKKYLLAATFLFAMTVSVAQTKPKPKQKEKPPTQKEMQDMMKEMQGAMDDISAEDKKAMDSMGIKMPDMKAILTKKEIRDVVSFLATLKENN